MMLVYWEDLRVKEKESTKLSSLIANEFEFFMLIDGLNRYKSMFKSLSSNRKLPFLMNIFDLRLSQSFLLLSANF
jgi:hypothetical protein